MLYESCLANDRQKWTRRGEEKNDRQNFLEIKVILHCEQRGLKGHLYD